MLKRTLTLILSVLILNLGLVPSAFTQAPKDNKAAKRAEKVKVEIAKLGTGNAAKVEIKLNNGSIVKGYVSQINDKSFFVTNEQSGTVTEIQYSDAEKVKGRNLSTGAKIGIGLGIAAGVLVLLVVIGLAHQD